MKNVAIVGLLSCCGLAASQTVLAAEDARYPGYNNAPQVLYQDWNLIKSYGSTKGANPVEASAAKHDAKFPGAYFEPYVIYRDPGYDNVTSGHGK